MRHVSHLVNSLFCQRMDRFLLDPLSAPVVRRAISLLIKEYSCAETVELLKPQSAPVARRAISLLIKEYSCAETVELLKPQSAPVARRAISLLIKEFSYAVRTSLSCLRR